MTSPCGDQLVRERSIDLDKDGRESTSPAVGLGRRKDRCIYPGPQEEAEDNVDHKEHSYVDTKIIAT
jgi:hypothetical protein